MEKEIWDQHKGEMIINNMMLSNDAFSLWLGISVEEINESTVRLSIIINDQMTNGFGIAHGGILYSLSDSALAFASNSHGRQAVSIETSISHLKPLHIGDKITAHSVLKHISKTLGHFEVLSYNQNNILVGIFKGTVYYTGKNWV